MKRLVIASVVALVVLGAGSMVASKEKEGERGRRGHGKMRRARHGVVDANGAKVQDANRPGRRVREGRRRAFEARLEQLESIRGLAVEEKATKTAAALDKFIAGEKKQFEERMQRMREWRRGRRGAGDKERGERRGGRRRGGGRRWTPEAEGET
ncbi:MAG: hypothetical protein ACYTEQ_21230 [Planctomycetota bacterium]